MINFMAIFWFFLNNQCLDFTLDLLVQRTVSFKDLSLFMRLHLKLLLYGFETALLHNQLLKPFRENNWVDQIFEIGVFELLPDNFDFTFVIYIFLESLIRINYFNFPARHRKRFWRQRILFFRHCPRIFLKCDLFHAEPIVKSCLYLIAHEWDLDLYFVLHNTLIYLLYVFIMDFWHVAKLFQHKRIIPLFVVDK